MHWCLHFLIRLRCVQYCGGCWAFAATAVLQDRIKIAKAKAFKMSKSAASPFSYPETMISVQTLLTCGSTRNYGNGCYGGKAQLAYAYAKKYGLPFESAQPYLGCGGDNTKSGQSIYGICPHVDTTCPDDNIHVAAACNKEDCFGLSTYPNVTVSDYGDINATATANNKTQARLMAEEILENGPIDCVTSGKYLAIELPAQFAGGVDGGTYQGGVINVTGGRPDHAVQVVGWGKNEQDSYWIVRNSWGEYWGNMGFFYVKKADNWDEPSPCGKDGCMSIELEGKCSWATIGSVTEMPSGNAKCGSAGQDCRTPTDPK